jgi:phage tail-like protein
MNALVPVEMNALVRIEEADECRLLRYLPGIYGEDPFLRGLLRLLEEIWAPLERQMGQLHAYFDPRLTPPDFLPWLGGWLNLVLDENWPEARRRLLIRRAAHLYERRGTAAALCEYLAIYLGFEPEIVDDGDATPFHFTVRIRPADPRTVDPDRVRRIIEEAKPAHTTYTLQIEPG